MVNIRPINDALQQVAREELFEVETRIPDDLTTLKEWIQKQPHLRACTEDQFLIAFLRGCKYSFEKAKSKLDHFFTITSLMPELYAGNVMDDKNIDICRSGTCIRLPKPLGPGGPRLHLTHYGRFDAKKYKMMDLFRFQHLVMLKQIYDDDNSIISGYVNIVDFAKMSLSLLTQFDPVLVKKLGVFAEKAAPMRNKGVHLINVPREAVTVLMLAKNLLSSKLQARFYVHKSLEDFYEFVPRELLPVEYGGTNGCIKDIQAELEQELIEFNEVFREHEHYGVEEALRPGRKVDQDSLFGIEGSFRKLDID